MTGPHRQKGMTGIAWLIVLALVGFFAMLIMKLGPAYLEYYKVKTTLASLKQEPQITKKSKRDVRNLVDKRLYINEVRRLTKDDIMVKKGKGRMEVSVEYEVRSHLLGNVDAIMTFANKVELISN